MALFSSAAAVILLRAPLAGRFFPPRRMPRGEARFAPWHPGCFVKVSSHHDGSGSERRKSFMSEEHEGIFIGPGEGASLPTLDIVHKVKAEGFGGRLAVIEWGLPPA